MVRSFLIILLFLPFYLYADLYNEGLKYEARGDYSSAADLFKRYFDKNINDINQDSVIEKLIYSSTLMPTVDEALDNLLFYVKYMENPNSRFRIYSKIAEIYELVGRIHDAGVYYEKAAYTIDDYVDYNSLFNSIEMLVELGHYEFSIKKLREAENDIREIKHKNRLNLLLGRLYNLVGRSSKSVEYLNRVLADDNKTNYYRFELGIIDKTEFTDKKTFEYIIMNYPYMKLRTPADYIGKVSELNIIPEIINDNDNEKEIYIGQFTEKKDAAGIINIVNQMNFPWFFDNIGDGFRLYIFSKNEKKDIRDLKSVGIEPGD